MFFVLSKILSFLLTPLLWIVISLFLGLFFFNKKNRIKKGLLKLSFIMLIFFSNPFITNYLMASWEIKPQLISKLEKHDVAIILTGVTSGNKSPRDRVYYQRGADRVLHPLQLFRLGKIKKILISGGSGLVNNKNQDVEAENLRSTLILSSVPDSVIIVEDQSKNTHENAVNSAKILRSRFPGQKYLLVTSAFHMRRSLACFKKENVEVKPFTVDFYSEDFNLTPELIVPSIDALKAWQVLFKEWFGIIMYKVAGYI